MKRLRRWGKARSLVFGAVVLLISSCFLCTDAAAAQKIQYERQSDRPVSEVLPPDMITGPHYRVRNTVVSNGYMNHFTVDSDFGVFEVTGNGALRKLIKEIRAIAALREIKKEAVYLDALKKAGTMPLDFGKNLITDPVNTVSGVSRGVSQLFSNVAMGLSHKQAKGEDTRMEQALAVSSFKRDLASQLGVDVYSSNAVLQKDLTNVAWAGALGSLSLSAALAPIGGPAVLTVQGTRLAQTMTDQLKEEPPARLRSINEEKLAAMGVPSDLVDQFLDHPSYTPRHQTIITGCLDAMKGASGRDAFLRLALSANDEETANFFQDTVETMKGYHDTVSPMKEISVVEVLVFARAENGSILVPFPLDHGVWSEMADRVLTHILAEYQASHPGARRQYELWVTGTVTPLARRQLAQRGMKTTEHVDRLIPFMD